MKNIENEANQAENQAEGTVEKPKAEDYTRIAEQLRKSGERDDAESGKKAGATLASLKRAAERDKEIVQDLSGADQEKPVEPPPLPKSVKKKEAPGLIKSWLIKAGFLGAGAAATVGLYEMGSEKDEGPREKSPVPQQVAPETAGNRSERVTEPKVDIAETPSVEEKIDSDVDLADSIFVPDASTEKSNVANEKRTLAEMGADAEKATVKAEAEPAPEVASKKVETKQDRSNLYQRTDTEAEKDSKFLVKRSPEQQKAWLERELGILERQLSDLEKEYADEKTSPLKKQILEDKISDNKAKTAEYLEEFKGL